MRVFSRHTGLTFKLLVICLAFSLPIGVLLYFVVSGYNQHINFAQKEKNGVLLLEPLAKFSKAVNRHQIYYIQKIQLGENAELNIKIDESLSTADSSLSAFFERMDFYKEDCGLETSVLQDLNLHNIIPKNIENDWNRIRKPNKEKDAADVFSDHQSIIERIHSLMLYIGNKSNLILDPDLDSYYLMDIALLKMPELTKQLSSVLITGSSLFLPIDSTKDKITHLNKRYTDFIISTIRSDRLPSIKLSLKTAVYEDKNFYGSSEHLEKKLAPALNEFEQSLLIFLKATEAMLSDTNENSHINTTNLLKNYEKVGFTAIDQGRNFWELTLDQLENLLETRRKDYVNKRAVALAISAGALLLALVLFGFILRGIMQPLNLVTKIIYEIATGNIRSAYKMIEAAQETPMFSGIKSKRELTEFKDEIYKLFLASVKMTASLNKLLTNVTNTSNQVASSAKTIADSAKNIEATVAEQAASTAETGAVSKNIWAISMELSATMDNISGKAQETSEAALSGKEGVEEIRLAISSLLNSVDEIREKLDMITLKTANISKVISTITKVANQTNLLSLNAAIEAENLNAKLTGENSENFGAGFSIVALEIRKLADETSVAALNIESLLYEMKEAVSKGSATVDEYSLQMHSNSAKISAISSELEEIIEKMQNLVPQFTQINDGMKSQTDGAKQIEEAMDQLNIATRQTRDSLVDFNVATYNLDTASQSLKQELAYFTIEEKGKYD